MLSLAEEIVARVPSPGQASAIKNHLYCNSLRRNWTLFPESLENLNPLLATTTQKLVMV